jgi:hypothetical protein
MLLFISNGHTNKTWPFFFIPMAAGTKPGRFFWFQRWPEPNLTVFFHSDGGRNKT